MNTSAISEKIKGVHNEKKSATQEIMDKATNDEQTDILKAAGLTGVCTDEHLTVVKAFGETSNYLRKENFNFRLTELLPNEIALIVKAAALLPTKTDGLPIGFPSKEMLPSAKIRNSKMLCLQKLVSYLTSRWSLTCC